MAEWGVPLPATTPQPPRTRQAQRTAWDADVFLTQLRRPGSTAAEVFGPVLRIEDMPRWAFVLVRIGRHRHYGVHAMPGRLRVVHWNAASAPPPVIPGVPAVDPPPMVLTATHAPRHSTRCRIIAADYRTVEPSTYVPGEYRRTHPASALPQEIQWTAMRRDESGWYRLNVRWFPPAFVTTYLRHLPDGVEFQRVTTSGSVQTIDHGRANSKAEYLDGIVEPLGFSQGSVNGDPRAEAVRDHRARFT